MTDLSKYTNRGDLFRFLKDNKHQIIGRREREVKCADAVFYRAVHGKEGADKAGGVSELLLKDRISVRSVINTTNLLDSHGDVHIKGLWKKSLKEQRNLCLLQEHQWSFDHIISDDVKADAVRMTWKELGLDFAGETEALVFESEIEKARNPFMFEQYARGYVKNHSVGMRYVQVSLCVNSDDRYYLEEKDSWDKYIGEVANAEEAEAAGYFWAVTEAKFVEGSAVPLGSNWATPTQSVKEFVGLPEGGCKDIGLPSGAQKSVFNVFNLLKVQK
jgi:hypothetical protein